MKDERLQSRALLDGEGGASRPHQVGRPRHKISGALGKAKLGIQFQGQTLQRFGALPVLFGQMEIARRPRASPQPVPPTPAPTARCPARFPCRSSAIKHSEQSQRPPPFPSKGTASS